MIAAENRLLRSWGSVLRLLGAPGKLTPLVDHIDHAFLCVGGAVVRLPTTIQAERRMLEAAFLLAPLGYACARACVSCSYSCVSGKHVLDARTKWGTEQKSRQNDDEGKT